MGRMFENSKAFAPMFDDLVKVTARRITDGVNPPRIIRGGFRACVLPMMNDDPFAEDEAQSARRRFSVLIAKSGPSAWNDRQPPQIGDVIELPNGLTAAVKKVIPVVDDWYELEAREC